MKTKDNNTATACFTVEVQYDPRKTDPDGLANALDRLMKTVLSTPSILDEYGNAAVGPFFVVDCAAQKRAPQALWRPYLLALDGPLFRAQRRLLMDWLESARKNRPIEARPTHEGLLEGLVSLTDAVADQAHDNHGLDCLLASAGDSAPGEDSCDCQRPGYWCSGVPGILAHLEDGRVAPDTEVERCDQCERYPSDEAALAELRRRGKA